MSTEGEGEPRYEALNEPHGATNDAEAARIVAEHPNEPNAIVFANGKAYTVQGPIAVPLADVR